MLTARRLLRDATLVEFGHTAPRSTRLYRRTAPTLHVNFGDHARFIELDGPSSYGPFRDSYGVKASRPGARRRIKEPTVVLGSVIRFTQR